MKIYILEHFFFYSNKGYVLNLIVIVSISRTNFNRFTKYTRIYLYAYSNFCLY